MSLTITPGTTGGGAPTPRQFVHAQFNGSVRFSDVTSCPCDLDVRLRNGIEGINDYATILTVTEANRWFPINAGGVTMVAGSGPVTITLHTGIFGASGAMTAYRVIGNVTAEAIPFGSTGTSAP